VLERGLEPLVLKGDLGKKARAATNDELNADRATAPCDRILPRRRV
jgi:hypothetical protein